MCRDIRATQGVGVDNGLIPLKLIEFLFQDVEQLPLVILSELYSKVWKKTAMESIKTFYSSYHEKKKAAWKASTMFISRQAGETERLAFKRIVVLMYE
jgi:hypothetical protein